MFRIILNPSSVKNLVAIHAKASRQTLRDIYDAKDPKTYYRPELNERFSEHFKSAAKIQLVVPNIVANTECTDIKEAVEFHKGDISFDSVPGEQRLFGLVSMQV